MNPSDQIIGSSDWPSHFPDQGELSLRWGRDCLYTSRAQETGLFDLADAWEVLCDGRTTSEHVAISTGGFRHVDSSEYTVRGQAPEEPHTPSSGKLDLQKVASFLADGSSLIFKDLQEYDGRIRGICRNLEMRTGRPTEAVAFLSPPGKGALPLHQDRVDVIVIQTSGTKHWQIFEHFPGQEGRGPVTKPPGSAPAYRLTLTPGDTCYMPAGWPHRTRSDEDWSLHISITISPISLTRVFDESFHRTLADLPDTDLYPDWDGVIRDQSLIDRVTEMESRICHATEEAARRIVEEHGVRRALSAERQRTRDEIAEILGLTTASDHAVPSGDHMEVR